MTPGEPLSLAAPADARMRIALLTPWSGTIGGPSKYVAALDQELRALGHVVRVISTDAGGGDGVIRGRFLSRDWRLFRALGKLQPDIIHIHGRFHFMPAALAYRALYPSSRIIFTFHSQPHEQSFLPGERKPPPTYTPIARLIARHMLRQCNAITAVSGSIIANLNALYSFNISRFATIPSGGYPIQVKRADVARVRCDYKLSDRFPVLSSIGVLSWDSKVAGHLVCIQAVARLIPRYPQLVMLIAGDGQYRDYLQRQANAIGVGTYVRFLGNVSDTSQVLAVSDIYVQMAMNEGCSLALIEAMFAGKAIIASKRGGHAEVVEDTVSARLIEPDATMLASTVIDLLENRLAGIALASGANKRARQFFTWPKVAKQYESVFAKSLESR